MKQVNGVWLPDEEKEITKFVSKATVDGVGVYQYQKLLEAMVWVGRFRNAVDVGAHCGLWAMQLEKRFKNVFAFEPIHRHIECLRKNAPRTIVNQCALGSERRNVWMKNGEKSTGDTHISEVGDWQVRVKTLDEFNIPDVDFIKLDCEGYELFALQGGEKTIDKYLPAIIVEQKPGKAKNYGLGDTEAVEWLKAKGYLLRGCIAGDYILSVP